MVNVAIIGSGMAGYGAHHHLRLQGLQPIVFEAAPRPGGHTVTHSYQGGWYFDEGPHVSFTKDTRIQSLLADNIGGDYQTLHARIDNYWNGYRIKHPAQTNLFGLPDDLVVACLRDFIEANQHPLGPVTNYAEWLVEAFGRTFAETFPMVYARKVHTTPAENLATDWLGPRLYRPSLEEVLRGAIARHTADHHYVTDYRYPTRGGFFAYLRPFLEDADLRPGHRLVRVDPSVKSLTFDSGWETTYDHLISSVPLPELVAMTAGAPQEVVEAAGRLAATSLVLVNIGVDRVDIGDTWTYFYDEDVIFARVSYPHRLSPTMAPPGCGSFQCEIYFSEKYRPRTQSPEAYVDQAIGDLRKCGLIEEGDSILHKSAVHVPYANIIHDHDKTPALNLINGWLERVGIATCGRYGLWGYQWTDEAFISGEQAAQRVLDLL